MNKLAVLAAAVLAAGAASADIVTYSTVLGPEVAGATGSGTAVLKYDTDTFKLAFDVDWAGLSGTRRSHTSTVAWRSLVRERSAWR